MDDDLTEILSRLRTRSQARETGVRPPYLYLDAEGVEYLFQEITGLAAPPGLRLESLGEGEPAGLVLGDGPGAAAPSHLLYQAMTPVVERRAPLVDSTSALDERVHEYARVRGRLRATRFPDGNLNLEIVFGDIRGLLFYTDAYFNSMLRPLLHDDRIHRIEADVEALVYVHGPVDNIIFYHQSYGDNREHAWAPLAPVVIRKAAGEGEDE